MEEIIVILLGIIIILLLSIYMSNSEHYNKMDKFQDDDYWYMSEKEEADLRKTINETIEQFGDRW
jgi:uncharacterized protein YxeA